MSIVIPANLKRQATARARREGVSFGEFVRQSIRERLAQQPPKAGKADPLFAQVPVFDGDAPSDVSADPDRYLYDEA